MTQRAITSVTEGITRDCLWSGLLGAYLATKPYNTELNQAGIDTLMPQVNIICQRGTSGRATAQPLHVYVTLSPNLQTLSSTRTMNSITFCGSLKPTSYYICTSRSLDSNRIVCCSLIKNRRNLNSGVKPLFKQSHYLTLPRALSLATDGRC